LKLGHDPVLRTRTNPKTVKCVQFEFTIVFDKKTNTIRSVPDIDDFSHATSDHLDLGLSKCYELEGFLDKSAQDWIQMVHEQGGHQVFLRGDPYPDDSLNELKFLL
jgi:hypothetical protein